MKRILMCVALAMALTGCAGPQAYAPVTVDHVAGFKKGITTESDVIAKLGRPMTVTTTIEGRTLDYTSMKSSIRGATFIPVVGLFAGGSDTKIDVATFTFDPSGKLLNYNLSKTSYGSSTFGPRQPGGE